MVCGVWCMVCGVVRMQYMQWCSTEGSTIRQYSLWCVVYGMWCIVCGVWCGQDAVHAMVQYGGKHHETE